MNILFNAAANANADAGGSAIALPVLSYRWAKNCQSTSGSLQSTGLLRMAFRRHLFKVKIIMYALADFYLNFVWSHFVLNSAEEKPAPVAQLDAPSDWRPGGRGFNTRRGLQHSFVEIDREIFSTGHSLPSADSRRAVVSFWWKNVHNTG